MGIAKFTLTDCLDVQAIYRKSIRDLLGRITFTNLGDTGRYWMKADWSDWYQMVDHEPTSADRVAFLRDASRWHRNNK